MNRRGFLHTAGIVSAGLAFPKAVTLLASNMTEPNSAGWRTFEVTTRVEILKPSGITRIWLPTALTAETPFQKTLANAFNAEGGSAKMIESKSDSLGIIAAEFREGARAVLTSTAASPQETTLSISPPQSSARNKIAPSSITSCVPRSLLPTDGIVKTTADEITAKANAHTDVEKVPRDLRMDSATTPLAIRKRAGAAHGDIRFMLETRDLGGKCADLNALYVGLSRAAGVPARDVYGIRVAKSELGYKSLGPATDNITKAQHCRAEVIWPHTVGFPSIPPTCARLILEESPGNRPLDDEMVKRARARLFGSWEMNWMAYNFAHDVDLPGSTGKSLGFLMYPQAETSQGRLDCLDPDNFKYEITSRETTSAAA